MINIVIKSGRAPYEIQTIPDHVLKLAELTNEMYAEIESKEELETLQKDIKKHSYALRGKTYKTRWDESQNKGYVYLVELPDMENTKARMLEYIVRKFGQCTRSDLRRSFQGINSKQFDNALNSHITSYKIKETTHTSTGGRPKKSYVAD